PGAAASCSVLASRPTKAVPAVEDAGAATSVKYNKRKAPDVDWRSITDPAERRRQRRLAKNRMTAARSRERKKEQCGSKPQHSSSLQPATKRSRTGLARQSLAYPPSASLLHFLVSVKLLLAHSSRPLTKAAQRLLFSHLLFSPPPLRKAMVPMSFAGLPLRSYVLA
ncbi:BZIP domain-containing protein, partial [Haematococcus lacustris]